MHSSTEPAETNSASPAAGAALRRWNRKAHIYLGLYLLFFVWLFFLTGLLLNHSQWKFAEFWENRKQTTLEHVIEPPKPGSDLEQARDLLKQLGLRGEIEWTRTGQEPNRFDFRVSRPGHLFEIRTDLLQHKATVQSIDLNGWGVLRLLHTFIGVRLDDSRNHRDWLLTTVWAISMDAVAAGLVLIVVSSLWMWAQLPDKRRAGAIVLALGFLSCGLFCIGLRLLF